MSKSCPQGKKRILKKDNFQRNRGCWQRASPEKHKVGTYSQGNSIELLMTRQLQCDLNSSNT